MEPTGLSKINSLDLGMVSCLRNFFSSPPSDGMVSLEGVGTQGYLYLGICKWTIFTFLWLSLLVSRNSVMMALEGVALHTKECSSYLMPFMFPREAACLCISATLVWLTSWFVSCSLLLVGCSQITHSLSYSDLPLYLCAIDQGENPLKCHITTKYKFWFLRQRYLPIPQSHPHTLPHMATDHLKCG